VEWTAASLFVLTRERGRKGGSPRAAKRSKG
jgi:hypothetical protein